MPASLVTTSDRRALVRRLRTNPELNRGPRPYSHRDIRPDRHVRNIDLLTGPVRPQPERGGVADGPTAPQSDRLFRIDVALVKKVMNL